MLVRGGREECSLLGLLWPSSNHAAPAHSTLFYCAGSEEGSLSSGLAHDAVPSLEGLLQPPAEIYDMRIAGACAAHMYNYLRCNVPRVARQHNTLLFFPPIARRRVRPGRARPREPRRILYLGVRRSADDYVRGSI